MSQFESFPDPIPDPIFGITQLFSEESREEKINLSIGAYVDETGRVPILNVIKQAEQELIESETTKAYFPLTGDRLFNQKMGEMMFGTLPPNAFTLSTPGGTGALFLAMETLVRHMTGTIHFSNPTWANHKQIAKRCGLEIGHYPYLKKDRSGVDFDEMMRAIGEIPPGEAICLQVSCHNPTGYDLTPPQWDQVLDLVVQKGLIPLFDYAYQGFASECQTDNYPLRAYAERGQIGFVAYSCSKNFSLYGERTGALAVLTQSPEEERKVQGVLKSLVRTSYSNQPIHGTKLVAEILNSSDLTAIWHTQLSQMKERLEAMTKELSSGLNLPHLAEAHGFFTLLPISLDQVEKLRRDHAIYMPDNGRIALSALNPSNIHQVIDALKGVL
ncbi:MAG: Aspartate aminotransferase [Chlamydiia bacterium]|nr:Aspartate aminotransferase [Chlamydiia bacterium]